MADFQHLDVYRCSLDFIRWATRITGDFSRKNADLAEQLRRASSSVPLNIAEGTGRRGKDRLNHNAIAYGSAKECLAVLDVAVASGLLNEGQIEEGKALLERIIAMLAVMSRLAPQG